MIGELRGGGRRELRFFGQLTLIVGAFVAYMAVRAVANDSPSDAMSNAHDLLGFERVLGLDVERRAQAFALDRPSLIEFFNVVYAWTYWPLLIGTFVYTWIRRRDLFVVYRNAIFLSGALGLLIFLVYPVAPPRFLDGFVDTIDAADRSHGIAHPSFIINKFAALPSFHVGWVTLACVVIAMSITYRPARVPARPAPDAHGDRSRRHRQPLHHRRNRRDRPVTARPRGWPSPSPTSERRNGRSRTRCWHYRHDDRYCWCRPRVRRAAYLIMAADLRDSEPAPLVEGGGVGPAAELLAEDGVEEVLRGGEVPVEGADPDPGAFGDLADVDGVGSLGARGCGGSADGGPVWRASERTRSCAVGAGSVAGLHGDADATHTARKHGTAAPVQCGVVTEDAVFESGEVVHEGHTGHRLRPIRRQPPRVGLRGVSEVLIDGRVAVSGAQPVGVVLGAVQAAWRHTVRPAEGSAVGS